MTDEDRARAALMEAIRGVVLEFRTEHESKTIEARYRPAVAVTNQKRIGTDPNPDAIPIQALLHFYADLLVGLMVDGRASPMGRSAMTVETFRLMFHLAPKITDHASEWLQAETDTQGQYIQRAARTLQRGKRR